MNAHERLPGVHWAFIWQTFSYDAAGNLTAEKDNTSGNAINRAYKYDMEGRLVEMNDGTANYKVKYVYDGLGRRLLESVTTGGSTVTKRNLWCGSTLCQLRDTTTLRLKRYFATGEYDYSASKKYLYRQDHLGSVRDLVDASTGLGVGSQDFDPYGNSRNAAGIQSDYRYAGLLWAQPIGLYLSATRAYDPGTTRWMTRDWIREAGGNNIYGYVNANPVMWNDPRGTCLGPLLLVCGWVAANAVELTIWSVLAAEVGVGLATRSGGPSAAEAAAINGIAQGGKRAVCEAGSLLERYLAGTGGRWGSNSTRQLNNAIAEFLESQGYLVTKGAGRGPEEFLKATGSNKGAYADITATNGINNLRVQTVDVLANGTPTAREIAAAGRIREAANPGDQLILIPKPPK